MYSLVNSCVRGVKLFSMRCCSSRRQSFKREDGVPVFSLIAWQKKMKGVMTPLPRWIMNHELQAGRALQPEAGTVCSRSTTPSPSFTYASLHLDQCNMSRVSVNNHMRIIFTWRCLQCGRFLPPDLQTSSASIHNAVSRFNVVLSFRNFTPDSWNSYGFHLWSILVQDVFGSASEL